MLWAVFPSFLGTLSLSLRHHPSACVAHGHHPRKPVCDSYLNLWLQDTWAFGTRHLSTPVLKYVKDHVLMSLEMEILTLFLKATATWGQLDSIHQFSWKWLVKGNLSCLYRPKEIHMSLSYWGPSRSRNFFTPDVSVQVGALDDFPWSLKLLLLASLNQGTGHPSTFWVAGDSLLGISSGFSPRSSMTEAVTYEWHSVGQQWLEQWELLRWETLTPQTELRDIETFLFYVSWCVWPVQGHPRIQTGVEV